MKIKTFVAGIKILVGMLVVSLIVNSSLCGQSDVLNLNGDNYEEKTIQGIVVVEYWAGWNIINKIVDFEKLENVELYRVNIDSCQNLQIENSVIVVPTIIFYDDGKEYKRLQGDLSFTLNVTKKDLQKIIDEILMSKF
jgi:hypothetical protein